jgi:hypothetical protein
MLWLLALPVLLGGVAASLRAQVQVVVGTGTNMSWFYPYSQYCYSDYYVYPRKLYTAILYSGWAIQQAGGMPGVISRIEFQASPDPYYGLGTLCQFRDIGQRIKVYLAISPNPNFPYQGTTYTALINGQAPMNLQNIQLCFDGVAFTRTIAANDWDGVDLQTPYVYTGGNLVVIIEAVNPVARTARRRILTT